jgi:ABC-type molybdate transport system substrate-binding protein
MASLIIPLVLMALSVVVSGPVFAEEITVSAAISLKNAFTREFVALVLSPQGQAVLQKYGFKPAAPPQP